MSTTILMKILESAPSRYDRGIRLLTLGAVDRAYDRLTLHIQPGQQALDLGCGTGALTMRAARRGAAVKGIDVSASMLEVAGRRVREAGLAHRVELIEMGVAELGREPPESYDAVTAGLCFSELTEGERAYALGQAHRLLRPGGLLLLADEVVPNALPKRVLHGLLRLPLVVVTYLLTQATTRAVRGLPEAVQAAGFAVESVRLSRMASFVELVARKPD